MVETRKHKWVAPLPISVKRQMFIWYSRIGFCLYTRLNDTCEDSFKSSLKHEKKIDKFYLTSRKPRETRRSSSKGIDGILSSFLSLDDATLKLQRTVRSISTPSHQWTNKLPVNLARSTSFLFYLEGLEKKYMHSLRSFSVIVGQYFKYTSTCLVFQV